MGKKYFYHYLENEKKQRLAIEQDLNLRLRQQEAIAWLGEYALGCADLDSLFSETVRIVSQTLDMELCKILELLPGGQELRLRAGVGWKPGLVGRATVGTDLDSQAGYTLQADEPVIVYDLATETRFSDPALLREHQVVSGMGVVIRGRTKPFGVLSVHTANRRNFYPYDTRFIKAIASILASAIDRFAMEDVLRRSRDELSIILQGISEGVSVQDRQGNIIYANQMGAATLGYDTVEQLLAAPLSDVMRKFQILDENGNPFPIEKLPGRLALQGVPQASAKIRFRVNATGEERWAIVDATPILDASGQAVQTVNIFRDITDMALSEQYQSFLAEAGALLASSLDYKTTLVNVAQLAVTNLADWCSIYLLTDSKDLLRLAAAHKDPAKVALAREYQKRYPPNMHAETGVAKVLRTGKAEYYPLITDEMLKAAAVDDEHLAMIRALGMKSVIMVPLTAHGRTLGAITFIWAESGRLYQQRDVDLANELARRAAMAIENARLYHEAQLTNLDLEQRVAKRTEQLEQSNRRLAREVEERQKTQQALQKSETMLNSLFESAPDAMILVDSNGTIARVNQQAETAFGYRREELLGAPVDRLIPLRYRGKHKGKLNHYMQEMVRRTMGAGLELSAVRSDGVEFPVDIMLSPVQIDDGEQVICAVRNMTEQKRLQSELAETHRRLIESVEDERLMISQELHDGPIQDLYGIALYIETLRGALSDPRDLQQVLAVKESVQSVVQTLRSLCGELRPPTLDQFGLEKAVRSHLIKMRQAHPEIKIDAFLMTDGTILSERARLALFRVYQNALSNTLRHAQARNIQIDFRIEEGEIHFTIKDDGRGFVIPARWVDLAREGHFGLVGMTERIQAIGGDMVVESAVGQGTTVRVRVPLESSAISDELMRSNT